MLKVNTFFFFVGTWTITVYGKWTVALCMVWSRCYSSTSPTIPSQTLTPRAGAFVRDFENCETSQSFSSHPSRSRVYFFTDIRSSHDDCEHMRAHICQSDWKISKNSIENTNKAALKIVKIFQNNVQICTVKAIFENAFNHSPKTHMQPISGKRCV